MSMRGRTNESTNVLWFVSINIIVSFFSFIVAVVPMTLVILRCLLREIYPDILVTKHEVGGKTMPAVSTLNDFLLYSQIRHQYSARYFTHIS